MLLLKNIGDIMVKLLISGIGGTTSAGYSFIFKNILHIYMYFHIDLMTKEWLLKLYNSLT